jgi:hypothetical protein
MQRAVRAPVPSQPAAPPQAACLPTNPFLTLLALLRASFFALSFSQTNGPACYAYRRCGGGSMCSVCQTPTALATVSHAVGPFCWLALVQPMAQSS